MKPKPTGGKVAEGGAEDEWVGYDDSAGSIRRLSRRPGEVLPWREDAPGSGWGCDTERAIGTAVTIVAGCLPVRPPWELCSAPVSWVRPRPFLDDISVSM